MRKINQAGLDLIKSFEVLRLEAVLENSVWTIGYGHTRLAQPGMKITRDKADELLREDLRAIEEFIEQAVRVSISDNQFAALVSFAHSVGVQDSQTSLLLELLNKEDIQAVTKQFSHWSLIEPQPLAWRRAYERDLFLTADSFPPPLIDYAVRVDYPVGDEQPEDNAFGEEGSVSAQEPLIDFLNRQFGLEEEMPVAEMPESPPQQSDDRPEILSSEALPPELSDFEFEIVEIDAPPATSAVPEFFPEPFPESSDLSSDLLASSDPSDSSEAWLFGDSPDSSEAWLTNFDPDDAEIEAEKMQIEAAEIEAAPDLPAAPSSPPLFRYPKLDCIDQPIINQPFNLFVQLLPDAPAANAPRLAFADTGVPDQLPEVEVVVRAATFEIRSSEFQVLPINRSGRSEVRFVLTPRQLGDREISVDFYQHDKYVGSVARNLRVVEAPDAIEVPQPAAAAFVEVKAAAAVPPPDLELRVILDRHDNRTLYYELHSVKPQLDYHHSKAGQVTLQASPPEKMQAVYRELNGLAALSPLQAAASEPRTLIARAAPTQISPERAERRLTTVGNQLWDELVSEELKQQYWQFKAAVKSVLITSDEPWIPWEMIKPYRHIDGKEEQEPFWCQQFAISRWLAGPGTADDLPAKIVLPVAPAHGNLASVEAEMAFLAQITSLRSGLSPLAALDRGLDLEDYLRSNEFSILHFACHGGFDDTVPNDSAIVLSDGPLRPSDLRLYFGQKQPRPLIFINACHGGRVGFSFTGLGGWAERFVKARVGAFVGAMWEVNDTLALQFARTFYKALLQDNQTIAEAFRQSREAVRQMAPYNSTWLAYSLYADPEARVQTDAAAPAIEPHPV